MLLPTRAEMIRGGDDVNEEFSGYIADFPRKTKGPNNRNANMVVAKDP